MHITKKRRVKTGKRHYRNKSHHHRVISHKKKTHTKTHTKRQHVITHKKKRHRRIRRNSDNNGEKLVDDSVSVYNKEKDSGNIINGMRDFLHKKSFIM
jgi:hypothetical protein